MHSRYTSLMAIVMLSLAACGGGGGGDPAPAAPSGFVATSVDDALRYALDNGADGIWVYAESGGATPVLEAAGIQSRATREPASTASLFKIASISKMFIATSSIKLVNVGTLRLDDTLAMWLPAVAARIENGDTITLRQLLQHRSGIPDFDSQPGFSWREAQTDLDALIALVYDKPADFAPGTRGEYSNTNYLLVGMMLDAALGYSHHDFVQNDILSPLGMTDTYSLLSDVDIALLARGYWDDVDRTAQDYVVPGGSMISTVADVGTFFRELATGNLLSDDERTLFVDVFGGYEHSGWLPGYQSIARYDRQSDTVLVQFINTTGGRSEQTARTVYNSLIVYLRNN